MDTTTSPPTERPAPAAITPLLRSVVLCDLVDSTALAERIGDVCIAELMQAHDRLLLRLLLDHQGQLIDKADGVLALFERPVNATAFALAYQRGLRDLGQSLGHPLQARVGIHVGDVMTWTPTPAEVLAGAKPVEVEGLAKPVAARLMGLALPGQILMSGMAQNLAQRAQGELGSIAPKLLWRLHGRYRFKGVPAPMLVHEVGELGIAPLRPPTSTEKAWRELPLWRKPPVLAFEVLLAVGLAVGGVWSMLKSPPAIAFNERDWVVVADFNNLTGETLYDEALDTALRVGLEQSRYVNVMSDLQVEDALKRMQDEGGRLDRQAGAEVALREGAKALVLPTVAQVGGRPRVTIEVVDPSSGVTVRTLMADANSAGALEALDRALSDVRAELGESLADIERSSMPLEHVTTKSLEALRAFSLGVRARLEGRPVEALEHFERAISLDPEFAMAHLRIAAIKLGTEPAQAEAYFDEAAKWRERLTQREAMLLDASLALFGPVESLLERWKRFAETYPDEFRAYYNFSYFAHFEAQRYQEAADFLPPAFSQNNPARAAAYYLQGAAYLVQDKTEEALRAYRQAESLGYQGYKRDYADAFAVSRDYDQADAVLGTQGRTGFAGAWVHERLPEVSYPLDRGQWLEAKAALAQWGPQLDPNHAELQDVYSILGLTLRSYDPDLQYADDLKRFLAEQPDRMAASGTFVRKRVAFNCLVAGWLAVREGSEDLLQQAQVAHAECAQDRSRQAIDDMALLLEAELAMRKGDAKAASELLEPRAASGTELYLVHQVLLRAYAMQDNWVRVREVAQWLTTNRGRAFAEPAAGRGLQLANVVESNLAWLALARAEAKLGNTGTAQEHLKTFASHWPQRDRLEAVSRRQQELD